jgi:hypothetical protein
MEDYSNVCSSELFKLIYVVSDILANADFGCLTPQYFLDEPAKIDQKQYGIDGKSDGLNYII